MWMQAKDSRYQIAKEPEGFAIFREGESLPLAYGFADLKAAQEAVRTHERQDRETEAEAAEEPETETEEQEAERLHDELHSWIGSLNLKGLRELADQILP